jgi:hypothetical protein
VRLVHAPVEGCVSLLSLIPRLIKRSLHVCVVSVGVAGWNTSAAWFGHVPVFVVGGLAHCWVLRRHPCGCCSLVRLLAGRLTHSVLLWVWWCRGFGVWLCVECCIVDASILLWSSV